MGNLVPRPTTKNLSRLVNLLTNSMTLHFQIVCGAYAKVQFFTQFEGLHFGMQFEANM